jgi:hypothetical protein
VEKLRHEQEIIQNNRIQNGCEQLTEDEVEIIIHRSIDDLQNRFVQFAEMKKNP